MGGGRLSKKSPLPSPSYFREKAFQAKLNFQEFSDLPVNNGVSVLIISTLRYGGIFHKYFKNI